MMYRELNIVAEVTASEMSLVVGGTGLDVAALAGKELGKIVSDCATLDQIGTCSLKGQGLANVL